MHSAHKGLYILLLVFTIIPAVLLASVFLYWGVHSLLYPFVPRELLGENALSCAALILTAAFLVYALFRPYSGGCVLCIWAVPLGFIFQAFRRSLWSALYPSWEWGVGYHPIYAVLVGVVLLLGVLFVIRGRLSRRAL